ncbi:ABC transporter permease [Aporhodopirellula aestuarii]|uniref:ABC transporter permease n=1 Tax=Aporhodopirellula aestuarii TaxID=2950107 RepID=A0ABT0U8Q0_9BACT|nr:ABC transporter permease [Aporhodopirellula aestuarii]MCM2373289.1 ABC transporter permease [Aporhodopirellula aestuarii]
MKFTTMTFRNVMRRPLRSGLTLVAVALAVCAVVSLVGIANGFKATFMDFYQGAGVDLLVVRSGSARRLTSTLEESLGDQIAALDGVVDVIPGLADVVSFPDEGLYVVPVSGLVPETHVFEAMEPVSGRRLLKTDKRGVMVGITLADSLGKKVGDQIEIVEDELYDIVGVFESFNVLQNGSLVVSVSELQRLMGREGEVSGFSIITTDAGDKELLDRISKQVEAMESEVKVRPTREHVESLSEIQLAVAMAWLTSAVAIVIGSIGVLNTMFMSIQERTLEIGLLRAIGWTRIRIISMILIESIILSAIGAAIGIGVSFVLVSLLTHMPAVNGLIEGRIQLAVVLQGLLIALVVGFLGGLLPAFAASKLSPSEALRH